MADQQTEAAPADGGAKDDGSEFVEKAKFDQLSKNHAIVKRKLEKAQKSQLSTDDLLKDPNFRKSAFQAWEVPHDDEGNFALPEDLKDQQAIEDEFKTRLSKARETWEKKELSPLKEQLGSFENENSSLKSNVLISSLERSAKKMAVLDGKFKPFPFGDDMLSPVHMAKDRFKYHPELKRHVLMDGETMELSSTGDPIFADNFFEHFLEGANDDVKREWLGDQRQRSSGFQSNGKPRGSYVMTRQEAAASPAKYRAAKKAAESAGQKLQLID